MGSDSDPNPKRKKRKTETLSSSSSSSSVGWEYEVFLSFNGEDTRKGFSDFLYTFLQHVRIHTFRDNENLRVGEEIGPELLKAIENSKISIPIFSKNYASSKWCLLELAHMVECREATTKGHLIFPIFYNVDPYDVRHQSGKYKRAFRKHKKEFGSKIVRKWKEALAMVGKLKGLELKKETRGHQGKLAKMVVDKVLLMLKKNYMDEPDNLVGMGLHIEKMKGLLDVNSSGIRIVGIHGMGGIGKTTIAKVIYNQLCERFEACHFLEDVRETAKRNGLNSLQDKLHRKKALVVLDDVDEKSQLDKLVRKCDWFGSGSRIIVTTRNKEVLDHLEVTYERKGLPEVYRSYEPQLMNPDDSLKLFSKLAFEMDLPPEDYGILSKEVVETAAGLPLVLVTVGSLLYGKEKIFWKEILKMLREVPHSEVMKKLRISFETLGVEQQQVFLDIACFFIGDDKEKPIYMWDACKYYPTYSIHVLVLRSLVKVRDDNRLWMHDQLRDLGRQIVHEEKLSMEKRSRLWRSEEAFDVLKNFMGTSKVVALYPDLRLRNDHPPLGEEQFRQLTNLRFLSLGYIHLSGDFNHLLQKLIWLKWSIRKGGYMPTNFHLKNLVILDLSRSKIKDEWKGWSQIKMATKLRVLDLSECYRLRILHCSAFAALEILSVHNCASVERLLELSKLTQLKKIDAQGCLRLVEIQGLDRLESLEHLDMGSCGCIERLPDLSNLVMLKKLDLHGCRKLSELEGLDALESLEILNVAWCHSLEKMPNLSNLKKLKELHMEYLKHVTEIPGIDRLESLELLDLRHCESVRILKLSSLGMLKILKLGECQKLGEVEGLGFLESLEILDVTGCISLGNISDLSNLNSLKQLMLSGLTEIPVLNKLKSLELLDIFQCESIEKLPATLSNLKTLTVRGCAKLTEIRGLEELKSLETLSVWDCKSIENLPDLSNHNKLAHLLIEGCVKLTEIRGLEELSSLQTLIISVCDSIEILPDLSNLQNLASIQVDGCVKLTEIRGLKELKSLKELSIIGCKAIQNLPNLPRTRISRKIDEDLLMECADDFDWEDIYDVEDDYD